MISSDIKKSISLNSVKNYLIRREWNKKTDLENIEIYTQSFNSKNEIHLPKEEDLTDYEISINYLLEDLSIIEQRSKSAIISDILQPQKDTISVSIQSADTQSGTIAFEEAIAVLENIRKALAVTAYSIEKPGTNYMRAYNQDVESFLEECRLAQTELGSYVIKIECPTEHTIQTTLEERPQKIDNFGRRTTKKFMESISHLVHSIDNNEIKKIIEPEGEPIVSANLCEAIRDLEPKNENFTIQIRMNWSNGVPVTAPINSEVSIRRHHMIEINEIAKKLQPNIEHINSEFIGKVAVLKGELKDKKQVHGEVILSLLGEEGTIRAKVELGRSDYILATKCHTEHKSIMIKGKLVRESPRVNRVVNYEYFNELQTNR